MLKKIRSIRVLRFIFIGALNSIVGYAIFSLLISSGLSYGSAVLMSTILGVVFNYFSYSKAVFFCMGNVNQFGRFFLIYVLVYVINLEMLNFLTQGYGFGPYLGQALCLPFNALISWILFSGWVYKKISL